LAVSLTKFSRRQWLLASSSAAASILPQSASAALSKTEVSIRGDQFFLNGQPTYKGRSFEGHRIEGLLMNSRMIQGVYDDLNPETAERWKYPDTGKWSVERNVREYLNAMPLWRRHGLLAFTIGVQGGSPEGYSKAQPWHNNGYSEDGSPRPAFFARLDRILRRADQLGMVAIVNYFYFGQDERLKDTAAVERAAIETTRWILNRGYRHVLVDLVNECNNRGYQQPALQAANVHELIEKVKAVQVGGRRLLTSTSFNGNTIPTGKVVAVSDYVLLHGNGVTDPNRIAEMVSIVRKLPTWRTMPVVFNEDDHFNFDQPVNNMRKALESYASWGYFDPGKNDYVDGYQSMPGIGASTRRAKKPSSISSSR
jgi:hypothetical protein